MLPCDMLEAGLWDPCCTSVFHIRIHATWNNKLHYYFMNFPNAVCFLVNFHLGRPKIMAPPSTTVIHKNPRKNTTFWGLVGAKNLFGEKAKQSGKLPMLL